MDVSSELLPAETSCCQLSWLSITWTPRACNGAVMDGNATAKIRHYCSNLAPAKGLQSTFETTVKRTSYFYIVSHSKHKLTDKSMWHKIMSNESVHSCMSYKRTERNAVGRRRWRYYCATPVLFSEGFQFDKWQIRKERHLVTDKGKAKMSHFSYVVINVDKLNKL